MRSSAHSLSDVDVMAKEQRKGGECDRAAADAVLDRGDMSMCAKAVNGYQLMLLPNTS